MLLDAAAYVSTHPLDLAAVKPDFVPVSFYKLFGYPTGLGALIVRKQAVAVLRKVYFGGGSVDYCTAEDAWHVLSEAPAGLEDGTLGYLSIAALKHGFNLLDQLGGMKVGKGGFRERGPDFWRGAVKDTWKLAILWLRCYPSYLRIRSHNIWPFK